MRLEIGGPNLVCHIEREYQVSQIEKNCYNICVLFGYTVDQKILTSNIPSPVSAKP